MVQENEFWPGFDHDFYATLKTPEARAIYLAGDRSIRGFTKDEVRAMAAMVKREGAKVPHTKGFATAGEAMMQALQHVAVSDPKLPVAREDAP